MAAERVVHRWRRRCALLGVVVFAGGWGVGCAARNEESAIPDAAKQSPADTHYDVAVGSFHNGMFEDAKLQLQKALAADAEHADSYYLQGVLLLNEGKAIIDSVEYQQCLTDAAAQQQLVRSEGLHRQAAHAFESAVGYFPEGAAGRGRAYNSMSVVSLHFHENEQAIRHAEAALKEQFYTDRYSALSNLGWAHYQKGDLVSATAQLRQAVMINPDYCVGHYRLSQVYLDSGLAEQALEHAQIVTMNQRCPIQDAHRIAGVAMMRIGSDGEASQALQGCVALAPRSCLAQDCQRLLGPDAAPSAGGTVAHARGDLQ